MPLCDSPRQTCAPFIQTWHHAVTKSFSWFQISFQDHVESTVMLSLFMQQTSRNHSVNLNWETTSLTCTANMKMIGGCVVWAKALLPTQLHGHSFHPPPMAAKEDLLIHPNFTNIVCSDKLQVHVGGLHCQKPTRQTTPAHHFS